MEEMLSLYDYLRRAAGPELGKQVEKEARRRKIPTSTKEVSNTNYTGKVKMYPRYFLDSYFRQDTTSPTTIVYNEPDDLPF